MDVKATGVWEARCAYTFAYDPMKSRSPAQPSAEGLNELINDARARKLETAKISHRTGRIWFHLIRLLRWDML